MPDVIPFALWSWVPITLLLFARLPPARAAALALVGGWLILPTARFADAVAGVEFPYWIMPACLPSDLWDTKARVIGVALLLGISAFDPRAWARLRPSWFDLPMLGWCLVPLASGVANGLPPAGSAADSAYLALSWGVPYLAGRFYFANPAGMTTLARTVVGGALAYLPPCIFEFAGGPSLYPLLYGSQPYRSLGMGRYVGFRPVVFLEDGNELGTWLAASSLVAWWLWRSGNLSRFWGMPGGLVAATLALQALMAQSVGSLILLAAGVATMEFLMRARRAWPLAVLGGVLLALMASRAANLVDAKALAMRSAIGRRLVDASIRLDRRSFGWRLRVEERAARVALRRPVLGWGRWDWWRSGSGDQRPWGLVGLALGMYGVAGWALLLAVFAAPVAALIALGPPPTWLASHRAPAAALAGALALVGLDAILNPGVLLAFAAAGGALVGLKGHAEAASAWFLRAGAAPR